MASARSLANLKSFKKGQSGNINGRPKKKPDEPTRKDWQEFALESPGVDKNGAALPCRNDTVMRTHYMIAIDRRRKDCMKAIEVWYYRVYGKVPDKVHVSGKVDTGENPLTSFLSDLATKAREDVKRANAKAAEEEEEEDEATPHRK
jgi:hypothetical protein